jgi:predicted metal-dependent hydrolase
MSQENQILISLAIAKNTYKLKIPANKESQIRHSVAELNTIIEQYIKTFPGQKEQDYIAMAFIGFIANQSADKAQNNNLLEALQAIEKQL